MAEQSESRKENIEKEFVASPSVQTAFKAWGELLRQGIITTLVFDSVEIYQIEKIFSIHERSKTSGPVYFVTRDIVFNQGKIKIKIAVTGRDIVTKDQEILDDERMKWYAKRLTICTGIDGQRYELAFQKLPVAEYWVVG